MAVSRMRLHGKNEFPATLLSQKRIMDVTRHFGIASTVYINKYDFNVKNSKTITEFCLQREAEVVG
jgi:MinD superfamily P-loop ATPase